MVIERDERSHYNPDGSLKLEDIQRQHEITNHLDCKFYRINESQQGSTINLLAQVGVATDA